jgi:hypothetical protein
MVVLFSVTTAEPVVTVVPVGEVAVSVGKAVAVVIVVVTLSVVVAWGVTHHGSDVVVTETVGFPDVPSVTVDCASDGAHLPQSGQFAVSK